MKTFYKTYNLEQAKKKKIQRENQFGVKFDIFSQHGGYAIVPIATRDVQDDSISGVRLYEFLDNIPLSFSKLSEISNLDVQSVLMGAQWLVRKGYAVPVVNRNGNFAGLYRKAQR